MEHVNFSSVNEAGFRRCGDPLLAMPRPNVSWGERKRELLCESGGGNRCHCFGLSVSRFARRCLFTMSVIAVRNATITKMHTSETHRKKCRLREVNQLTIAFVG